MLTRFRVKPSEARAASTSRLGDWYARPFNAGRTVFVLAASERSLLPVIVTAAPNATFVPRLVDAACDVLAAIGIDAAHVDAERRAMSDVRWGRSNDRRILGSMTDFVQMLPLDMSARHAHAEALQLARAPCKPIGMNSPIDRTLELFRE